MEPIIGVNFAHFLPYGSGQFNSGNRLLGAFGSATLDGVSDYYAQLLYKVCSSAGVPPRFLAGRVAALAERVVFFPSSSHLTSRASLRLQFSGQAHVLLLKGFGCERLKFLFRRESKL